MRAISPHPRRSNLIRLLATILIATAALSLPGTSASADADGNPTISRKVVFTLDNTNNTALPCVADGQTHEVYATLVGPRAQVLGRDGSGRINVLVHDLGTGAWFWNLPERGYDYARTLAAHGETSLIVDRLGYDASTLAEGRNTCLGAQASMLHELIQHLYSGTYAFASGSSAAVPHASHVTVHGHGVGAAIAQLEAGTFDDVDSLVLMSWSDSNASQRAVTEAMSATQTCLGGASYAPYGKTAADFRELLFASATRSVLGRATELRNQVPCGDVTSLAGLLLASTNSTAKIEVPVLLLYGSKDALNRSGAAQSQAGRFVNSPSVRTRTFAGAGSALPLEKSAPAVSRVVLGWLAHH